MRYCLFLIILCCFTSCEQNKKSVPEKLKVPDPEQIVVISMNSPGRYSHVVKKDSIGKKLKDSIGPKMYVPHYGFSYLDSQNEVQTWTPKKGVPDTLIIPYYKNYLELLSYNPYTSIPETFLIKNGDTVVFNYENNLPIAEVINRQINDTALNYNRYRLKNLFGNKYSSHQLLFVGIFIEGVENYDQNTLNHYLDARKDYKLEQNLLDSLLSEGVITEIDHQYRTDALNVLMEKHKRNKLLAKWLDNEQIASREGELSKVIAFDLGHTDSLMTYGYFRDHLKNISMYDLPTITENNGGSGGSYIDARIRFDSILQDKRFNQRAKDFLLFDAYNELGPKFSVKDKKEYLEKLEKTTANPAKLKKLIADHNLDFQFSDQLLLTNRNNDTITYGELLKKNQGKWLYVDFWASWCAPCRRAMPASAKLQRALRNENIEFLYISMRDDKTKWKAAIISDSIQDGQHFFAENSNTSTVLEDLGINAVPHYIIYNPKGDIEHGYADRPGKGAKEQLEALLKRK